MDNEEQASEIDELNELVELIETDVEAVWNELGESSLLLVDLRISLAIAHVTDRSKCTPYGGAQTRVNYVQRPNAQPYHGASPWHLPTIYSHLTDTGVAPTFSFLP